MSENAGEDLKKTVKNEECYDYTMLRSHVTESMWTMTWRKILRNSTITHYLHCASKTQFWLLWAQQPAMLFRARGIALYVWATRLLDGVMTGKDKNIFTVSLCSGSSISGSWSGMSNKCQGKELLRETRIAQRDHELHIKLPSVRLTYFASKGF